MRKERTIGLALLLLLLLVAGCTRQPFLLDDSSVVIEAVTQLPAVSEIEGQTKAFDKEEPEMSENLPTTEIMELTEEEPEKESSEQDDLCGLKTLLQQEYERLLKEQREGYEYLVRAPEKLKTLTGREVQWIFNIQLPSTYRIIFWEIEEDPLSYHRPCYTVELEIPTGKVSSFANSLDYYEADDLDTVTLSDDVDRAKVFRFFFMFEDLCFVDEEAGGIIRTSGCARIYVMEEKGGFTRLRLER